MPHGVEMGWKVLRLGQQTFQGEQSGRKVSAWLEGSRGAGGDSCTGAGFAQLGLCSNTRGSLRGLVSWARGDGRGEGIKKGCPTLH